MAGKKRNELTPEEKRQIRQEAIELLALYGNNKTAAAAAAGTSRQAFGKWTEGTNMPKTANLRGLREALETARKKNDAEKESALRAQVADYVRPGVTKVASGQPRTLAPVQRPGLASAPLRGEIVPAKQPKGQRRMGALLARAAVANANEEPAYKIELEVCLYYHREEIANGDVAQTTISAAREGAFEAAGCANWAAKRWWEELLARDPGFRESMNLIRVGRRHEDDEDDDLTN